MSPVSKRKNREWSLLPVDLLDKISKRLSIIEFVRFRAVCLPWRSAVRPCFLTPQPWLMMNRHKLDTGLGHFFTLSDDKIYTLPMPEAHMKVCHGSSHGWLVLQQRQQQMGSLSVLNPFTRAQIQLPPLNSVLLIRNAVLSSDPALDSDCFVCIFFFKAKEFAYCRVGGESWTVVPNAIGDLDEISDAIYYKGRFYVSGFNGKLAVCEVGPPTKLSVIPSIQVCEGKKNYLVESSGELLLVVRYLHVDAADFDLRIGGFRVFKINLSGELKVIEVKSLHDHTLFVGPRNSLSLAASHFNGYEGDCIYFIEYDTYVFESDVGHNIGVFNLKDDSIKQLPCNLGELVFDSQGSQWITPIVR